MDHGHVPNPPGTGVIGRLSDPPLMFFVVDEIALYRAVGSTEEMAEQMAHLTAVAAMPNVTLQVLPAIAHPATASGFVLADNSAGVST